MGLLELCLLPLLSLQDPAATAVAAPPPQAPTSAPKVDYADPLDIVALQRAEQSSPPDFDLLDRLLAHDNPAVAIRAVWILGQQPAGEALPRLQRLARQSPLPEARLQAMAALLRSGAANSLDSGIQGLDDPEPRVRTLAAQLLGRLRAASATKALLALLRRPDPTSDPAATIEPQPDALAALLALHDLADASALLPAAMAVQDSGRQGLGQALAFYWQGVSPRLAAAEETTILLSVLDHHEPLLRRYALSRLAQLAPPAASTALAGRLDQESDELRPLVEVALARCRPEAVPVQPALARLQALREELRNRWQALNEPQQQLVLGLSGLLLASGIGLVVLLLRRRKLAAAAAASALDLVNPSEEHLEDLAAAADAEAAAALAAETVELMDEVSLADDLMDEAVDDETADFAEQEPMLADEADEHAGTARS